MKGVSISQTVWFMKSFMIVVKRSNSPFQHVEAGDIVWRIARKGHENYQEIEGVRYWFESSSSSATPRLYAQHHTTDLAYPAH